MIIDFDKKIHEQITPETWCSKGARCNAGECIGLWIVHRYGYSCVELTKVYTKLHISTPEELFKWNDSSERTFTEVHSLLKELDI